MSSVCCRPLPPTHRQEFWGREGPAEREGEPRAPGAAERTLRDTNNLIAFSHQARLEHLFWSLPPLFGSVYSQGAKIDIKTLSDTFWYKHTTYPVLTFIPSTCVLARLSA